MGALLALHHTPNFYPAYNKSMAAGDGVPGQLAGKGFSLRRWEVEDAAWYVAVRDEEIFRWTSEKRDLTIAETEEAIRRMNAHPRAYCFAIVDQGAQRLLGNIALVLQEANLKTAEIMYWLAPEGRGRGIATMAVTLLCHLAFQSMGVERIILKTKPGNTRSQHVAERAGFRQLADGVGGKTDEEYCWFELLIRDDPGKNETQPE